MPAPPLAHLGHWYVSLPIFMGPVLLIAVALKIQTWRERKHGSDTSGKRSTLTITSDDRQKTTITITGPLDYPVLVELESALATVHTDTPAVTLDLRKLTDADQEAAWSLCDAISRAHRSRIHVLLAGSSPHAEPLARILAAEAIEISHAPLRPDPCTTLGPPTTHSP
jgi:ABC-type transporter Mla MlaB component